MFGSVLLAVGIAGCSEPEPEAIDPTETVEAPDVEATESAEAFAPVYGFEIDEGTCPDAVGIDDEHRAPAEVEYERTEDVSLGHKFARVSCEYTVLNLGYTSGSTRSFSDGVASLYVAFAMYDHEAQPNPNEDLLPVDFGAVPSAAYFSEWLSVAAGSEIDPNESGPHEADGSVLVEFEMYGAVDNLQVDANITFATTETDFDVDSAGFEVLESIVAPVIEDLPKA